MEREYNFKLADLKILYINLDRRPERKINIENELKRLKLKGTRISAVDGQSLTDEEKEYWMNRKNFNTLTRNESRVFGRVGCYLSHLKTMKYALDNNIWPLLILEDDCKFLTDHNDVNIRIPSNTDIYYLGGLYWWKVGEDENSSLDYTFDNFKDKLYYDDSIQILPEYFRICCTFAYILPSREHIHNLLLQMMDVKKKAIDMMYVTYVQKNERSFIIQPSLCVQSDEFTSDVTDFGLQTPSNPYSNTYFYDTTLYTIPRVLEFYNNNYHKVLQRLLKYYKYKKIVPNPNMLFKHLRIVSKEIIS
jgi:GR25 family glycosyltransferase involved in LPS biosynthesis